MIKQDLDNFLSDIKADEEQDKIGELTEFRKELLTSKKRVYKYLTLTDGCGQQRESLFCKCGSLKNGGYSCMRTDCNNTMENWSQTEKICGKECDYKPVSVTWMQCKFCKGVKHQ